MKGHRIAYSASELAWLEANRTMVISDYHLAFQAEFGRPGISAANLHGLRKRMGWKVGRAKGAPQADTGGSRRPKSRGCATTAPWSPATIIGPSARASVEPTPRPSS